jgi:hypothetical protein
MPKERLYILDSGQEPSPVTPAQRAFFRWRYTAGSFEYAREHGLPTEAVSQQLAERYNAYRALRDGGSVAYEPIAGGSPDLPEPNALPAEMAAFLQAHEYGCLLWATDQGAVFVAKAPRAEMESLRGRVSVHLRHELYALCLTTGCGPL